MKTYIPKDQDHNKKVYLIDADGKTLGRLATRVACLLLGKGKSTFAPDQVCGDQVIVVNAKNIAVTGRKKDQKIYKHFTGYPSGLKTYTYEELQARKPEEIITRAVSRMLPKTRNGARMLTHLRVYAGAEHKQKAQKPEVIEV